MKYSKYPSKDFFDTYLSYNPSTGDLTWKPRCKSNSASINSMLSFNSKYAGNAAGTMHGDYLRVKIMGRFYYCHRVCWILSGKDMPEDKVIDHINGIGSDNRIENMRVVSQKTNTKNAKRSKANTTGYTGVYYERNMGKFRARIPVDGKKITLGFFDNALDAHKARKNAERNLGFHKNHGRVLE